MRKASSFQDELEGVLQYMNEGPSKNHVISRETIRQCLDWVYVSCWYAEPVESHAMWQLYGKSTEAVAIETSEQWLRMAYFRAATRMQTYLEDVRYTHPGAADFGKAPPVLVLQKNQDPIFDTRAVFAALFSYLKHTGYSFEKEARLVIVDPKANADVRNPEPGYTLPVDATREIVREVILHPSASSWFENLVVDTVRRYGVDAKVRRSMLAENAPAI